MHIHDYTYTQYVNNKKKIAREKKWASPNEFSGKDQTTITIPKPIPKTPQIPCKIGSLRVAPEDAVVDGLDVEVAGNVKLVGVSTETVIGSGVSVVLVLVLVVWVTLLLLACEVEVGMVEVETRRLAWLVELDARVHWALNAKGRNNTIEKEDRVRKKKKSPNLR